MLSVGSNILESKLVVFELDSQRKFFSAEDREESQVLNFLSGRKVTFAVVLYYFSLAFSSSF